MFAHGIASNSAGRSIEVGGAEPVGLGAGDDGRAAKVADTVATGLAGAVGECGASVAVWLGSHPANTTTNMAIHRRRIDPSTSSCSLP